VETSHKIIKSDSRCLSDIEDKSVDLVITSPPYPIIKMWDDVFIQLSPTIKSYLDSNDGLTAFELMNLELDKTWDEVYRVLKDGSFACINIGDAVRSFGNRFQLFPNHYRIIQKFLSLGFDLLPSIFWNKPTNAPNKFMGSGMLPSGAYMTQEHEYILIFRKGPKRLFNGSEKENRLRSAIFWEERNNWFCDRWDFKGSHQRKLKNSNRKSAEYPFELPYRLINMFSLYGETVLDPFVGVGTTSLAAVQCARNSIGVDIDSNCTSCIFDRISSFIKKDSLSIVEDRLSKHIEFTKTRRLKYENISHGFPVMTRQETNSKFFKITDSSQVSTNEIKVNYSLA
jgi:DNA modification methylase